MESAYVKIECMVLSPFVVCLSLTLGWANIRSITVAKEHPGIQLCDLQLPHMKYKGVRPCVRLIFNVPAATIDHNYMYGIFN